MKKISFLLLLVALLLQPLPHGVAAPLAVVATPQIYDDKNLTVWTYTGTWFNLGAALSYGRSYHLSARLNNEAALTFSGERFELLYTRTSAMGTLDIYVDNVLEASLLQTNPASQYQQRWISPTYADGVHNIRLVHASGRFVSVDGIQVFGPPDLIAPASISDLAAAPGSTGGSAALTWSAPGDDGATGTTAAYLVRYSLSEIVDETAWNAATPVTSGVPTPLVGGSLQSITINGLAPGQIYFFMVRARDEEPNLGGLSNSPSSAATVSTPLGVGKHDDKNVNLFYGGTWTNQASFAAYASGLRYSQVVGNSVGFMFSGTDFVLSYLASNQQGMLDIYIDGAKITSLNQFNAKNAWQRKWNSPILTNGIHSVQFVHASGGRVNVDAIQVQATIPVNWPTIGLESVVSGLAKPVLVTHAGDGSGRLFIVEKGGTIRIFQGGSLLPTPFLDITARVASAGERGLLSMAFPPDYASKDYFYVFYTNLAGTLTVSRFSLTVDPTVADDTSEQIILSVPHSANANHNGGHIAFSPVDGYLYFSSGDGGGAGDPSNNGQNKNTLLGKILRIDVETGSPATYTVPATNPFVGVAGLDEIWAYGLRNPWRFSFDRLTGDLYIGDVGQGAWEEVDFQSAGFAGGANYGWRIWEGKHCYSPSAGCIAPPAYVPPVAEYSHSLGCSITGGYVYRGNVHPTMQGIYFASDYCSGRIFGVQNVGGVWVQTELLDTPQSIVSFGEDEAGNLYIAAYNGTIYRVVVP